MCKNKKRFELFGGMWREAGMLLDIVEIAFVASFIVGITFTILAFIR